MPKLIVIYRSVRLQSHENVEGMLFIYDPIFRVELEKIWWFEMAAIMRSIITHIRYINI